MPTDSASSRSGEGPVTPTAWDRRRPRAPRNGHLLQRRLSDLGGHGGSPGPVRRHHGRV